jgi:hypothetical protein
MDTIFVALANEVSQNWWAVNAYWWVPAATVLVTILGIIISTRTSAINTNKQIQNQNREGKRPCLTIEKTENCIKAVNPIYYILYNKGYKETATIIRKHIQIKNIGYGVAAELDIKGIKLLDDVHDDDDLFFITDDENDTFEEKESEIYNNIHMGDFAISDSLNFNLIIKIPKNINIDKDALFSFTFTYKDLNENKYQTNIFLGLLNDYYSCYHMHLVGTEGFYKKLIEFSKYQVDEENQVKET